MANDNLWMPLDVADYLADTMHLTTLQNGAYAFLLMHYWRHGPLPNDPAQLMTITRADRKTWTRDIWPVVKNFFRLGDDGLLHQKRSDVERARASDITAKRRAAAQSRWQGNGHDEPPPTEDANAYANASPHADANRGAKRKQTPSKGDAKAMHSRARDSLSPSESEVREEREGVLTHSLRAREKAPLPNDWKPSTKSRLLAATLGFDEAELARLADQMRTWAWAKNYQLSDWDWRFNAWLNEAAHREKTRQRPEPKSRNGFDAIIARYEAAAPFTVIDGDGLAIPEPRKIVHG